MSGKESWGERGPHIGSMLPGNIGGFNGKDKQSFVISRAIMQNKDAKCHWLVKATADVFKGKVDKSRF